MKTNRVGIAFIILLTLSVFRIITDGEIANNMIYMSLLNVLAVIITLIFIKKKTLALMYDEQKKRAKRKAKLNNPHISNFENLSKNTIVTLCFILLIYSCKFSNYMINDILTIITLVLAIEDNDIAQELFKKYYRFQ